MISIPKKALLSKPELVSVYSGLKKKSKGN